MLSASEGGCVRLGLERAKILAEAVMCHPVVPVFPGWEINRENAAWRSSAADMPCITALADPECRFRAEVAAVAAPQAVQLRSTVR